MLTFAEIFLTMNAERSTLQLSGIHTSPARMLEPARREVHMGGSLLHIKFLLLNRTDILPPILITAFFKQQNTKINHHDRNN